MSSDNQSSDSSDTSEYSNDSEWNDIPGYYAFTEVENRTTEDGDDDDELLGFEPYSDEPLAEQEWLEEYTKRQEEKEERLKSLERRLSGLEAISNWCSCGYCCTDFLQNPNECYCCKDLEKCCEALSSEWVLQEVEKELPCITLHPGFQTVCLNKWSLRMAALKYQTIDKKSYKQTKSEDAFLRSVSYREFIHLVHGRIGRNRVPLPACAYNKIRSTFNSDDDFTGFQEDEKE